jgi:hypothetical protein
MARRQHSPEIEGASHVVAISHPKEVAEVVMTAVRTCTSWPAWI